MARTHARHGFTIVELLIVIVVIGILVTITAVAFSGIRQNAEAAVIKADLTQARKQVLASQVETGTTPEDESEVNDGRGFTLSNGSAIQYTGVDNGNGTGTFCITLSRSGIDYMLNYDQDSPSEGVCPGHTPTGSVEMVTVTNIATNPSLEEDDSYWTDSRSACVQSTSAAYVGTYGFRCTVDGTGYMPRTVGPTVPATSGQVYTLSAWIRSSAQVRIAYDRNSGGAQVLGPLQPSTGNWVRVSMTTAALPSGTVQIKVWIGVADNTPDGTLFDVDGLMMTEGSSLFDYADGQSSGWSWNGTPHLSTSTGQLVAP